MKITILLVMCLALVTSVSAAPPKYIDGQLLVQFHEPVTVAVIQGIIAKLGTKSDGVMFIGRERIYLIKIMNGLSVENVIVEFKKFSEVKSASPNYIRNPN